MYELKIIAVESLIEYSSSLAFTSALYSRIVPSIVSFRSNLGSLFPIGLSGRGDKAHPALCGATLLPRLTSLNPRHVTSDFRAPGTAGLSSMVSTP